MKSSIALLAAFHLCGCDAASPIRPSAPSISQVQPSAASVGQTVTLVGSGFTPGGNILQIGDGYLGNLTTSEPTWLRFTVPEHLDPCPPGTQACIAVIIPLLPGSYKVWVTNANGTSNAATLQVVWK